MLNKKCELSGNSKAKENVANYPFKCLMGYTPDL